jgi:sugar fermentation stimulation protein A
LKLEDLLEASFERRLNRFLVSVKKDGQTTLAHLANPGRLGELLTPNRRLWLARRRGHGATEFKVVAADLEGVRVYLESRMANSLFREAVERRVIPEFRGLQVRRIEPRYRRSRFDFLLGPDRNVLIEVKSCTLVHDGVALFPDAPTRRGARQATDLAHSREDGFEGWIVFIVQRSDVSMFRVNRRNDPSFARALTEAVQSGVSLAAWRLGDDKSLTEIGLRDRIPIDLEDPEGL